MAFVEDPYNEDEDFIPLEAPKVLFLQNAVEANRLLDRGGAWEALIEQAQDDAFVALGVLANFEFTTLDQVRKAQWEVQRYEKLAGYINGIFSKAKEATADMTQEDADQQIARITGEVPEQGD